MNAEYKGDTIKMRRCTAWKVTMLCAQPTSFIISLPSDVVLKKEWWLTQECTELTKCEEQDIRTRRRRPYTRIC